jgi:hypothetical protein
MAMSKQHFEALAEALRSARPPNPGLMRLAWVETCRSVADVCARFNGRFDRARFLRACGAEGFEQARQGDEAA